MDSKRCAETISRYFGSDKKGISNFEQQKLEGHSYFAGRVKRGARKVTYVFCFYVDGDLDLEAYKGICRERKQLGLNDKVYVFARGLEIVSSRNIMFYKVSKDGSTVLDYSGVA